MADNANTETDHEPEILPKESWLDRDDPRFGQVVDADEAPTSSREWARISAKLTEDALCEFMKHVEAIPITATVMAAYDHRDKAFNLIDKGKLELSDDRHRFEYADKTVRESDSGQ